MNILIVIPARSGSVRVPHKNVAPLFGDNPNGQNLLGLATTAAINAATVLAKNHNTDVVISTDEVDYINRIGDNKKHCAICIRPPEISGPNADIADAVAHTLEEAEQRGGLTYDWIVTLQPAVPLRTGALIAQMVLDCARLHCVAALTGCRTVPWHWSYANGQAVNDWSPKPYPRSQSTDGTIPWQEINSIQVARRDIVVRKARWDLPLLVQFLPPWAVLDIDTPADFARARHVVLPLLNLLASDSGDGALVISNLNGLTSMSEAS